MAVFLAVRNINVFASLRIFTNVLRVFNNVLQPGTEQPERTFNAIKNVELHAD